MGQVQREPPRDFLEGEEGGAAGSPIVAGVFVFPFEANFSGSFRNLSAQPFEQKYHVFPPCSAFAAARAGSTLIPQTGSIAPAGGGERTGSDSPK
jgi:hypothetical protein